VCTRAFVTILAFVCLSAFFSPTAGCRALDLAMKDVNDVGHGARKTAEDPNNALPDQARTILELFGGLTAVGYGIYKQFRGKKIRQRYDLEKHEHRATREEADLMSRMHQDATQALEAIVKGVDAAPDKASAAVKGAIAQQMKQAKIYDRANTLIDELKGAS